MLVLLVCTKQNSSDKVENCRLDESISRANDQNYNGEEVIERNKKLAKAFLCKLQCRPALDFSKEFLPRAAAFLVSLVSKLR